MEMKHEYHEGKQITGNFEQLAHSVPAPQICQSLTKVFSLIPKGASTKKPAAPAPQVWYSKNREKNKKAAHGRPFPWASEGRIRCKSRLAVQSVTGRTAASPRAESEWRKRRTKTDGAANRPGINSYRNLPGRSLVSIVAAGLQINSCSFNSCKKTRQNFLSAAPVPGPRDQQGNTHK